MTAIMRENRRARLPQAGNKIHAETSQKHIRVFCILQNVCYFFPFFSFFFCPSHVLQRCFVCTLTHPLVNALICVTGESGFDTPTSVGEVEIDEEEDL